MTRHASRSRAVAAVAVLALTASACGSNLTEDEVLARTGVEVMAEAEPDTGGEATSPGAAPATEADAPIQSGAPRATGASVTGNEGPTPSDRDPTPSVIQTDDPTAAREEIGDNPTQAPTTQQQTQQQAGCRTSETGPIVIGNVGNYSGAGGSSQSGFPVGVQVWAAMVNSEGGLCGREVDVVVQDDGSDPARYGAQVRDLVENRGVVAFVGNGAVLSAQGNIEYHKSSGVPVIGNDCSSDIWYDSAILAPTCPRARTQSIAPVRSGVELTGSTKFGYLYCTEAKACQDVHAVLQDGGVEAAGAQLLYSEGVSIAQVDFTAECQSARDAGVEIFWVAADPATVSRAARSCARQNYRPQWVAHGISFGPDSVSEDGLEDVILTNPVFPFAGASTEAIDEYTRAVETFAPGTKKGPALSTGWTSAKLFELVATRAARDSGEITPETLRAALLTVKDETLGGLTTPLTMTQDGAQHDDCYFLLRGAGDGSTFTVPKGPGALCL